MRGRHFRARGEPLGVGPRLHDSLGIRVPRFGQFGNVVEIVENEQRLLEALSRNGADFRIAEHVDQRLHVVAAKHGAEQFGRLGARDQRAGRFALGHLGKELGLDLGRIVHTGRHPVGDQFDQRRTFPGRRIL